MSTESIDTLTAIVRRSLLSVVLLVIFGVAAMDAIRHSQGPQYQATSRVVLAPTDLSQLFAGASPYIDPTLVDQTEKALANSPQLFDRAAKRWAGTLGTGGTLRGSTSVSKDGTTIAFSASARTDRRAVGIANAVAHAYPEWRAQIEGAAIENAIKQVQAQLRASTSPPTSLVDQLNRLKVLRTLASGNVLLVEPAGTAAKTRPRPIRDSIMGALIGLFVGLLVVAGREALDTRVRSEDEVEELLDVPVVGGIEKLPRGTVLVGGARRGERFADMYALVAASIAQDAEHRPTVIAVSSATAREGKTTTASNLAAALARRNANVVLVDLDTRKPSVAKVFHLPVEAQGIEQVLRRNADPESIAWTVSANGVAESRRRAKEVVAENITNGSTASSVLRVIPLRASIRGGVPAHFEQIQKTLEAIGRGADYVVVDTPPALSLPDMTELAKIVDVVLLVVRHGRVTRRDLTAMNRLHRSWRNVRKNAVLVGTPRPEGYAYYKE